MFSEQFQRLMRMQFFLVHDCMRSIIYFRYLGELGNKAEALTYTKDVLAEHAIINWTKLFGAYKEDTHWKKLAEHPEAKIARPFGKDSILGAVNMSEDEWKAYHNKMLVARNEFFAHFDMKSMTLNFPAFSPALAVTLCYREWLSELVDTAIARGLKVANKAVPNQLAVQQFENSAKAAFHESKP